MRSHKSLGGVDETTVETPTGALTTFVDTLIGAASTGGTVLTSKAASPVFGSLTSSVIGDAGGAMGALPVESPVGVGALVVNDLASGDMLGAAEETGEGGETAAIDGGASLFCTVLFAMPEPEGATLALVGSVDVVCVDSDVAAVVGSLVVFACDVPANIARIAAAIIVGTNRLRSILCDL
jgi:hypothetical protein